MVPKSNARFRMEQDEIAATVFRPSGFVVAGVGGLVLAVADGADARRVNARLGQGFAERERAAFAERAVVFFRAAFVAIAFDEQLVAGTRCERRGDGGNIRLLAFFPRRAI